MTHPLLETATFAPGVAAATWRDAVRAAGVDLAHAGAVGPTYADQMIARIEDAGPYCVLAPGVAVPHAKPSAVVRRGSIAIVTLAEPVTFGHAHNDPVRVVIGLATQTAGEHIRSLAWLANELDRPGTAAALVAATTRDEAIALLGGGA